MRKKPIWEQLEGEPVTHYQNFVIYRDLGPHRTMVAAYMALSEQRSQAGRTVKDRKYKTVPGAWTRQADKWIWQERVEAFDDYCRQERDRRNRELEEEMHLLRMERSREQLEAEWNLRSIILQKVSEMLAHPLYTKAVDADGKTVVLVPAKWSIRDIAPLAKLAMDLGRNSTGMNVPQLQELQHVTELVRANWLPSEVMDPLVQKSSEVEKLAQQLLTGSAVDVEAKDATSGS